MDTTKLVAEHLLERVKEAGYPVGITSSAGDFETIPVFQDVRYPGSVVEHLGFGYFRMKTPKGDISFDGGGAMYRISDEDGKWVASWTFFRGDKDELKQCGLDVEAQLAELEKIVGG